jgi:hypothetical protein
MVGRQIKQAMRLTSSKMGNGLGTGRAIETSRPISLTF